MPGDPPQLLWRSCRHIPQLDKVEVQLLEGLHPHMCPHSTKNLNVHGMLLLWRCAEGHTVEAEVHWQRTSRAVPTGWLLSRQAATLVQQAEKERATASRRSRWRWHCVAMMVPDCSG